MSEQTKVGAYEVVDHGIQHSQYFQGCGVSFTEYSDVATGIGDDFAEALEDALESLAQAGWGTEDIEVPAHPHNNGRSVSAIREQEQEEREAEAEAEALAEFLEENPDKTEDDFEWEGSEDDDTDGDERWYTVSVRVREFDPARDGSEDDETEV